MQGVVALASDGGIGEAEANGSLRVESQSGVHTKCQASQGYLVRPWLQKTKQADKQMEKCVRIKHKI